MFPLQFRHMTCYIYNLNIVMIGFLLRFLIQVMGKADQFCYNLICSQIQSVSILSCFLF